MSEDTSVLLWQWGTLAGPSPGLGHTPGTPLLVSAGSRTPAGVWHRGVKGGWEGRGRVPYIMVYLVQCKGWEKKRLSSLLPSLA